MAELPKVDTFGSLGFFFLMMVSEIRKEGLMYGLIAKF